MQKLSFQCLPSFTEQETMPQYNVPALFSISFITCYEQEFLKGEPGSKNQSRKLLGRIQMTTADTTPLLCSDTQGDIP